MVAISPAVGELTTGENEVPWRGSACCDTELARRGGADREGGHAGSAYDGGTKGTSHRQRCGGARSVRA